LHSIAPDFLQTWGARRNDRKRTNHWLINDYKLGADSWWFKQGIPATLNFPEYFVLTAKEDKTPLEKAPRENIADKIIDTNDTSFAHQAFPQMGNVACQTHHIIMLGTYSKPLRS
jgi:hypothetical protein